MSLPDSPPPAADLLRTIARASHDLRQPFSSMAIFLHLLEQELTTPRQRQIASRLRESVESGRDLLNALLDLAALDAGRVAPAPAPVPLEDLLLRVAEGVAPAADERRIRLSLVPTTAWVSSDAAMLERMLRALVANALAFTPVGGGRGRVVIGVRRRGGRVAIQVWDDGPGIAAGDLERIFEPFERLDTPRHDRVRGLGLGLALARRTAALLGHRLAVRSRPGRGSVFEIEAPAVTLGAPAATAGVVGAGATGVVVLLEDDVLQRLALEDVLTGWGWVCVTAAGAAPALAALMDRGLTPTVVVADLNLGGGERGDAAIRRIREAHGPSVRGIVVTGDTDDGLRRTLAAGGLSVLHKPVDPATLRNALAGSSGS
jgi:CheY-like chemotaxis protein/anti-sigma regulatory factor (Ser/Thr protein kinase)